MDWGPGLDSKTGMQAKGSLLANLVDKPTATTVKRWEVIGLNKYIVNSSCCWCWILFKVYDGGLQKQASCNRLQWTFDQSTGLLLAL